MCQVARCHPLPVGTLGRIGVVHGTTPVSRSVDLYGSDLAMVPTPIDVVADDGCELVVSRLWSDGHREGLEDAEHTAGVAPAREA